MSRSFVLAMLRAFVLEHTSSSKAPNSLSTVSSSLVLVLRPSTSQPSDHCSRSVLKGQNQSLILRAHVVPAERLLRWYRISNSRGCLCLGLVLAMGSERSSHLLMRILGAGLRFPLHLMTWRRHRIVDGRKARVRSEVKRQIVDNLTPYDIHVYFSSPVLGHTSSFMWLISSCIGQGVQTKAH